MSLKDLVIMDGETIDRLLDYPSLVEALYQAHRLDEAWQAGTCYLKAATALEKMGKPPMTSLFCPPGRVASLA